MSKKNICLSSMGAKIISFSSTSDESLCQPSNVLTQSQDQIWNSGEGLPQYLIISLQNVQYQYSEISTIGFFCWHDYETNPRTIQIQVAEKGSQKFVLWEQLNLECRKGQQFFDIRPIPCSYKVIKVNITDAFGDYETYLNQVLLLAHPSEYIHQEQSEMSLHELDLLEKAEKGVPFSKTQKNFRSLKNKRGSSSRKVETQEVKAQSEEEYPENTFHQKQLYSNSRKEERNLAYGTQQESQDESFNNNIALLELSKKAVEMEEDMEEVKRQLSVLNLKVDCSLDTLQNFVKENVELIIEDKFIKLRQELRQQFRSSRQKPDIRQVKSQKDKRDFVNSREVYQDIKQYNHGTKGKSSREKKNAPQSLHIHNLNYNEKIKEAPTKDSGVTYLMSQLNQKLKQRELKVKKMEVKEKSKRTYHPEYRY